MPNRKLHRGFTLIELMIVLAVIGILATIAFPAFTQALIRSDRADGRRALLDVAIAQDRFRSANVVAIGTPVTYGTRLQLTDAGLLSPWLVAGFSEQGRYAIEITAADRGSYTVTATAQGRQATDATVACRTLTLTGSLGSHTKAPAECW